MRLLMTCLLGFCFLSCSKSGDGGSGTTDVGPSNLSITPTVSTDNSGNVSFIATATNAVSYEYDFGNGQYLNSTTGSVNYKYTTSGTYTITVKAKSATGKTASAMRRASLMSGARPARSIPSRMGTSPESVVSVPAPISTWPERTRRTISLPARLRSACVESCTCTRPLLRAAVPSRSTGISTRVYCGWVGSGCVTAEMRIGAPAGSVGNCAAAEKTMPVAITTPARSCFNIMKTSKVRLFVSVHHVHAMTSTALHHFAGCTAIQCRAISTRRVIQTSRLSAM